MDPRKYYSENARVCAKWQWNARDFVTGLHDRRSRECNPITPVECVSLSFRTHPCVLAFITYILCTHAIEMALVYWIYHKKVIRSYIFFKFAICSIALLSLGETCHLKGRDMVTVWRTVLLLSCYDCGSTHQHYDATRFEYVLWRRTIHKWVMNIHYQNLNRPRAIWWTWSAPPRNNGSCVIILLIWLCNSIEKYLVAFFWNLW